MSPLGVASLRSFGKSVFYGTPLHRLGRFARRAEPSHRTQAYWDEALSGSLRPYLGGTISIDVRNAITAQLVRSAVPAARSLLDVGCAAGTLAKAVRTVGIDRYVGMDISAVAIRESDATAGEFHVSDLCSFDPSACGPFDAIVFNEVLYYTDVDVAPRQLARYAQHLTPNGVLAFSLKDDPKSRAILDAILRRFAWVTGTLFQEEPDRGRYAIRANRERPAYLVGLVRPGVTTEASR